MKNYNVKKSGNDTLIFCAPYAQTKYLGSGRLQIKSWKMPSNCSVKYKGNILKLVLPDVNNIYVNDTLVEVLRISFSATWQCILLWHWQTVSTHNHIQERIFYPLLNFLFSLLLDVFTNYPQYNNGNFILAVRTEMG